MGQDQIRLRAFLFATVLLAAFLSADVRDLVCLPHQQQCHAPSDEIVHRMERNRSPNASGKFPRKAQDPRGPVATCVKAS
jgi:hypothetical protein